MFDREENFDTAEGESAENLVDPTQNETRPLVKQESDSFSYGGEGGGGDTGGYGYWERQRDPATGMIYYLNDKVGLRI